MSLPQEIITIIKGNVNNSEEAMKVKVFEDCIVPFIFKLRLKSGGTWIYDPPTNRYGEKMVLGRDNFDEKWESSFMLTAIKRVCKSMMNAVSPGVHMDSYRALAYLENKAVKS
uniref:Uncharacterized protein n=1 Tax=Clandestinovirus TaxID=2831644 RepID=A0A8F8KTE9_9VIRU|nr:hypothetical protein KOM_12_78 [Clandestinovirus]